MSNKINKKGFVDWDGLVINILGGIWIVFFVVCMTLVLIIMISHGDFEYKTFNGETGYSDYCYLSRGGLFCSSDGGYVQVESYNEKGEKQ